MQHFIVLNWISLIGSGKYFISYLPAWSVLQRDVCDIISRNSSPVFFTPTSLLSLERCFLRASTLADSTTWNVFIQSMHLAFFFTLFRLPYKRVLPSSRSKQQLPWLLQFLSSYSHSSFLLSTYHQLTH